VGWVAEVGIAKVDDAGLLSVVWIDKGMFWTRIGM
jgi:hypothetical protein